MAGRVRDDVVLYGASVDEALVAVEHHARRGRPDEAVLFVREGDGIRRATEPLQCGVVATHDVLADCPVEGERITLEGDAPLDTLAMVPNWAACCKLRDRLSKSTQYSPSAPNAPYVFLSDPVHQHLLLTGRTLFFGMQFEDLRRMQVDIECHTTPGYDFCNADRGADRIIAIAMSDQTGWSDVLWGEDLGEADLIARFVETVRQRDPDVLEGHNIFNFDLPYLRARAERHGLTLALGRDGSDARRRGSRVTFGERTISYDRFDIYGRHVVDTLFLVQAYDIVHRSLPGFGLKQVAVHFGLAADDRTYVDGHAITEAFARDPERVVAYCRDDVLETQAISALLSRSAFLQTQMLPYSYQNVCVRGSATRIDALMIREYLRRRHTLPIPGATRRFAGGYTDMFLEGVVANVHHCDVRSLYPSLMLTRDIQPASDSCGVFLQLLERLRDLRFEAKQKMQAARTGGERLHFDALQSTFKILINSFYGYLGFGQARFSDFDAAERVASDGRELLHIMIDWLRENGATPIEIDTDGIYFVPPEASKDPESAARFEQAFADALPDGIDIEFDGRFKSMYSYKMKNYALLSEDGEMVIKGAALKSRGLEPFLRSFLADLICLKLEGRDDEAGNLRRRYEEAIRKGEWPIAELAKTERLQDSPATYQAKVGRGKRGRSAAYELALKSDRDYRAGDQVAFYVTGAKKNVAVHEAARLASDWSPDARDENVPYYLDKLHNLCKKFDVQDEQQTQLGLL